MDAAHRQHNQSIQRAVPKHVKDPELLATTSRYFTDVEWSATVAGFITPLEGNTTVLNQSRNNWLGELGPEISWPLASTLILRDIAAATL